MASTLRATALIACAIVLFGCSSPWSSGNRSAVTSTAEAPVPSLTGSTETAVPSPTPSVPPPTTSAASPASVGVRSTPSAAAVATATGQPPIAEAPVARCCGTFSWIDSQHLLVFDTPITEPSGSWVVDVSTGSRQFLASDFGIPSSSGLVAVPEPSAERTEIRRLDGSIVSTINNGGVLTWISPDGKHVAWLEDMGVKQVSSLVPRTVRLWSAGIDGSAAKPLLEFEASGLQWLPDSQHVIALARSPDGRRPGIWVVDTVTGTNGVVVDGTFLQALRLSADRSRIAYLNTFSGNPNDDGVWTANTNGQNSVHLRETGSYRWAGDSSHLWFLELAPAEGGDDALVEIDTSDDSVVNRVNLGARVLNDEWDVSPDGSAVVYWDEADQSVTVKSLLP